MAPFWIVVPDGLQAKAVRRGLAEVGGAFAVHVGTFGDLYTMVLRRSGRAVPVTTDPIIYRLVQGAVAQLLKAGQLSHSTAIASTLGFIQTLVDRIAEFKRSRLFPGALLDITQDHGSGLVEIGRVYAAYQRLLEEAGWTDPEGLNWLAVEALEQDDTPVRNIQLVVVDGFDSFNASQMAAIKLLGAAVPEVIVTLPGHPALPRPIAPITAAPCLGRKPCLSTGTRLSASCADGYGLDVTALQYSNIRSPLAESGSNDVRWMAAISDEWGVEDIGPRLHRPVRSDIPTLLVSRRFDPITPTYYAELVADTLPNSTTVEFPNVGHGVIGSSDCADSVFSSFLSYPDMLFDTTCVGEIQGFDFALREDVVPVSWTGLLLGYFEGNWGSRVTVYLVVAAMAVMVVVVPLWVVGGAASKDVSARRLARRILRRRRRHLEAGESWWARNLAKFSLGAFVSLVALLVVLVRSIEAFYYRLVVVKDSWALVAGLIVYG